MIPTKTHDAALTSGTADTAQAQIAMTPEMYELLSAGIYEDRPLAMVRELTSNARDAQKEAGNGSRAIKVHLPNSFEPFFSVRDFGTGLTHDQVFDIYLTYGASTKRGSNEFVGMFGIGSKSPLSYTDSFLVTTYLDGVERQYNIYKDKGIPKIAKLSELSTTEENGLKVTVAIRREDFYTFQSKVELFGKLFDQELDVDGATVDSEVKYSEKNDLYHLVSNYPRGAYALMGGVPYRLSEEIRSQLEEDLMVDTIILPFELGSLNIASSRENLSFNEGDATDQAIKDRVNEIKLVFTQNMEKALDSCETLSEVLKTLRANYGLTSTSYYSESTNLDHVTWNQKTLKEWRLELDDDSKTTEFKHNKMKVVKGKSFGIFRGFPDSKLVFFDSDRKTGNVKAVRKYKENHLPMRVLVDVSPIMKAELEEIHGDIESVSCSAIYEDLFPKVETEARKVTKVSGVFRRNKTKFGPQTLEIKEVDGTEVGYYVDMVRDTVTINNCEVHKTALYWLVDEGIVDNLWFIRKTAAKKNHPKSLLKLDDHVDKLILSKINQKTIKQQAMREVFDSRNYLKIPDCYQELIDAGLFKGYYTLVFYTSDKNKERGSSNLGIIMNNLYSVGKSTNLDNIKDRISRHRDRIAVKYEQERLDFISKYPILMAAIASWNFGEEAKEQLIKLLLKEI